MIQGNSERFEQAWADYHARIEALRRRVYALEWIDRPGVRASAHYYFLQVQATAFNMVIGPRRDYPSLSIHLTYEPVIYTLSNHSADFNIRFGFVDGRRTYRLWGKRNRSLFVDIQIVNVIWGTPGARKLGNFDLDSFVDAEGNFEIVLSATPHNGHWIPLDPDSQDNLILLREAFDDWEQPRADIEIQRVEEGDPGRASLDEEELARRLVMAANYIEFYIWTWAAELTNRMLAEAGPNAFHLGIFKADQGAGNNPAAQYPGCVYALGEDEAIVVEADMPAARYWNVQLSDALWQVIDFTYHQSSLNSHQARVDADGRLRCVISRTDPGIANWLDSVDNPFGIVFFRVYGADREVEPTINYRGSLAGALERLPPETERVSPAERARRLARRAAAARARFE